MSSGDMPFKIPIVGPCARTGSGSTVRVENDAAHSTSDSIGNLLDDLAEGSRADLSPGWLWVHSDFMGGWAARMLPGAARPFSQLLLVLIGFCVGRFSCVCGTQAGSTLVHPAAEVVADLYRPPPSLGEVAVYESTESSVGAVVDARGSVHNLLIGGFRFNVLVSEPGTLRSGDCHERRQLDMIFEGAVAVTTRESGVDVERRYAAGELVVIPANVPHMFRFLNRTVMAEWWDGGRFETRYYSKYRKQVDAALRERQRTQRHQRPLHLGR